MVLLDVKTHDVRSGEVSTTLETSVGMDLDIVPLVLVIICKAHTFGMAWQGALYGAGSRLGLSLIVEVQDLGDGYEGDILAIAGCVVFVLGIA